MSCFLIELRYGCQSELSSTVIDMTFHPKSGRFDPPSSSPQLLYKKKEKKKIWLPNCLYVSYLTYNCYM